MPARKIRVGEGLGIKPIDLGEPFSTDSGFDSTVRLQPRTSGPIPGLSAPPPAGTVISQPKNPPYIQPPPAQPQPPTQPPGIPGVVGPALPQRYDPQTLNFEGYVHQPQAADLSQLQLPDILKRYLPPQPGDTLETYLDKLTKFQLDQLKQQGQSSFANGARVRLESQEIGKAIDQVRAAMSSQATGEKINYLGQQTYNQSIARLKQANAVTSRDDEEQLMATLASRGLLNSGIASAEIGKLHEARLQNFYNAADSLNQLLMSGEISRLTSRDMATLEADLQKRNQEALANIQGRWAVEQQKAGQPSVLAQIAGTAIGVGAGALLSPKKPSPYGAGTTRPIKTKQPTKLKSMTQRY